MVKVWLSLTALVWALWQTQSSDGMMVPSPFQFFSSSMMTTTSRTPRRPQSRVVTFPDYHRYCKQPQSTIMYRQFSMEHQATSVDNKDDNSNRLGVPEDHEPTRRFQRRPIQKIIKPLPLSALFVTLGFVWLNKHTIIRALPSTSDWTTALLPHLDRLREIGNLGYLIYAVTLFLWTLTVGMTTFVETAAGMAFGTKVGIPLNALGKIGGALAQFGLGRTVLKESVQKSKRIRDNPIMNAVQSRVRQAPLQVALMIRFAPLPEFIKNFGLSVLDITSQKFSLAVMLHGFPFTCLWTYLGSEATRILHGGLPSQTMKFFVTFMTWFTCISPVVIGLWVKSLGDDTSAAEQLETK